MEGRSIARIRGGAWWDLPERERIAVVRDHRLPWGNDQARGSRAMVACSARQHHQPPLPAMPCRINEIDVDIRDYFSKKEK